MTYKAKSAPIALASFALSAALFYAIKARAVNVLFWDQWDFYTPVFQGRSLWSLFFWQHGPHFQGIAYVFTYFLDCATHWNSIAESALIGALLVASLILVLALKARIFSPLEPIDIIFPLLLLNNVQLETVLVTPNPSLAAFPILLVFAFAAVWSAPRNPWRSVGIAALLFCLPFTGFGVAAVPPALALLMLTYVAKVRARFQSNAFTFLPFAALVLAMGIFAWKYHPGYTLACVAHVMPPVAYLQFVGRLFAGFLSLPHSVVADVFGLALFGVMSGACLNQIRYLARGTDRRRAAIFVLTATTVTFTVLCAAGRTGLGVVTADSSRYMTWLVPGFVGLALALIDRRPVYWFARVALLASLMASYTVTALHAAEQPWAHVLASKRLWRDCYLARHDVATCDEVAGFAIYPDPAKTHLQQKLDYLETHRLNLFGGRP